MQENEPINWTRALGIFFGVMTFIQIIIKIPSLFLYRRNRWTRKQLTWFQRLLMNGVTSFGEYWNNYEIHEDKSKPIPSHALLLGYHSRGTLDLVYFVLTFQVRFVVYHLVFQIPLLRQIFKELRGIPSAKPFNDGADQFIDALVDGSAPVMLLPGGVFEMAKRYEDRYKVIWKDDPGFARVVVNDVYPRKKDVCVVPFHTKNSESCYFHIPWLYTATGRIILSWSSYLNNGHVWIVPFFIIATFITLGFIALPVPISMDTYFGDPIYVKENETSKEYGKRVTDALQELVTRVEEMPEKKVPERSTLLRYVLNMSLGFITLYQNIWIIVVSVALTVICLPPTIALFYITRFITSTLSTKESKKSR